MVGGPAGEDGARSCRGRRTPRAVSAPQGRSRLHSQHTYYIHTNRTRGTHTQLETQNTNTHSAHHITPHHVTTKNLIDLSVCLFGYLSVCLSFCLVCLCPPPDRGIGVDDITRHDTPLTKKEHMERESANTIVGINAPVDLSGRTPLAWSVKAKSRNREVSHPPSPTL